MTIFFFFISLILGVISSIFLKQLKTAKENLILSEERIKEFKKQYTNQIEELKKLKSEVVDLQNQLDIRQQEENYRKELFILEQKQLLDQINSLKSNLQELQIQKQTTQKQIDTGKKVMTQKKQKTNLVNSSPLIGSEEQALFSISDTREKADKLQEILLPKLEFILDTAQDLIRQVYGDDALPSSLFRLAKSPTHRKTAKETADFQEVSVGICPKSTRTWFFQLQIGCNREKIYVVLFGLRGKEVNPLVSVMKSYKDEVVKLINICSFQARSEAMNLKNNSSEKQFLDMDTFIDSLELIDEKEWKSTGIDAVILSLPILDLNDAKFIIDSVVALYPIFNAASCLLINKKDNFLDDFDRFLNWHKENWLNIDSDKKNNSNYEYISADELESQVEYREGLVKQIKVNAYERDPKARKKCIEYYGTDCVVCGFNFGKIFGKLGEGFIHVHHLKPISSIGQEYLIDPIKDLRPVCPNCHAMLHQGKETVSIENLKQMLEENCP